MSHYKRKVGNSTDKSNFGSTKVSLLYLHFLIYLLPLSSLYHKFGNHRKNIRKKIKDMQWLIFIVFSFEWCFLIRKIKKVYYSDWGLTISDKILTRVRNHSLKQTIIHRTLFLIRRQSSKSMRAADPRSWKVNYLRK